MNNENLWYTKVDSVFNTYRAGDEVRAMVDFHDTSLEGRGDIIKAGTIDIVESVSSNHHGGLQLNLVKHGRKWSNHVWRKVPPRIVES